MEPNFRAVHGLRAAGGGGEEGSPAEEEASEAAAAAGEVVEKENAEILGRRRELTMRDMARLAREVTDTAPEARVLVRLGGQRV
jgi:hypothetical protein